MILKKNLPVIICFLLGFLVNKNFQEVVDAAVVLIFSGSDTELSFIYQAIAWSPNFLTLTFFFLLKVAYLPAWWSCFFNGIVVCINYIALRNLLNLKSYKLYCSVLLIFLISIYLFSFSYSVDFFESYSSFGYFAFSWVMLTFSFWLRGKNRKFLFAIGLLLSIHPAYFFWVTLLVFLSSPKFLIKNVRRDLTPIIMGLAISFVVIFVHLFVFEPSFSLPLTDISVKDLLIWDIHRTPVKFFSIEALLLVAGSSLSVLICIFNKVVTRFEKIIITTNFILLFFLAMQVLELSVESLTRLMPQRLFGVYAFLLLSYFLSWIIPKIKLSQFKEMSFFGTLSILFFYNVVLPRIDTSFHRELFKNRNLNGLGYRVVTFACKPYLIKKGLASIMYLDWIDMGFYNPKILGLADKMTTDIYDFSLKKKAIYLDKRKDFFIDPYYVKNVWQNRSSIDWKLLGDKYKFRNVVVPLNWELNLMELKESSLNGCKMYSVYNDDEK